MTFLRNLRNRFRKRRKMTDAEKAHAMNYLYRTTITGSYEEEEARKEQHLKNWAEKPIGEQYGPYEEWAAYHTGAVCSHLPLHFLNWLIPAWRI
jgi:hypothetical protein